MTTRPWGRRAAAAATAALLSLTACTGDDSDGGGGDSDPADVLAAARTTLDETSGVRVALSTADLPSGVTGVESAAGVGTPAPAFEGSITVRLGGNSVQVPVVAVDDKVFAELPFTSGYQEVDPAEYGAPDPARLLAGDGGFSSMLTEATQLEDQGAARNEDDPDEVLHTVSGTVPGSVAADIVPTADGDFEAVFEVAEDEELRRVDLTGVFYPGTRPMTYRVTFDDYGTDADINAP